MAQRQVSRQPQKCPLCEALSALKAAVPNATHFTPQRCSAVQDAHVVNGFRCRATTGYAERCMSWHRHDVISHPTHLVFFGTRSVAPRSTTPNELVEAASKASAVGCCDASNGLCAWNRRVAPKSSNNKECNQMQINLKIKIHFACFCYALTVA